MLTKLFLDQAIMKAKSHINKKEIVETEKFYQDVLLAFSNNIRAQKELAALNNHTQDNAIQTPPLETLNQLVNLCNQEQFSRVVEQVQSIMKQYPQAFVVRNILGAAKKISVPQELYLLMNCQ